MNNSTFNYTNGTPHSVIIAEIMKTNHWFVDMNEPEELIRKEVERQLEFYTKDNNEYDDWNDAVNNRMRIDDGKNSRGTPKRDSSKRD